jgi:excisionase family DNA binding protein
MPRSLLIAEAGELLGVSRRTVYYWIRDGRLRTVATRGVSQRVTVDSIEEALRSRRRVRVRGAGVSGTGPSAKFQEP